MRTIPDFQKLFKKTPRTQLIFFLVSDIFLISLSVLIAFLLRFDARIPSYYFEGTLPVMIILALLFSLPMFFFFRLYSFSWTYVSTSELISLVKAVTLSFALLVVVFFVLRNQPIFQSFPRSTLFISYFLVFILSGGLRFSKRIYLQIFQGGLEDGKERTLIIGAGDAGEQILRNIKMTNNPYLPIGFLDDDLTKQGILIHGLKILGRIDDASKTIKENQIEQMIIALPTAGTKDIRKAVELGREAGLKKIKIVPSINEIINDRASLRDLREIQVEDLLGRDTVSLDAETIKSFIQGKTVLITGAAGSIGSELSRQVAKFQPSLLLVLDQDETGIFNVLTELKAKFPYLEIKFFITSTKDQKGISQIFSSFRPNIIFHAAAYKHVPLMEEQAGEAVKNNVLTTEILAEAAIKYKTDTFVFISTDKAVNPESVMGTTKRIGEMLCQVLNQKNSTKFISVRFGNVLNSRGSVIPIFTEQIKRGGPVEVTHPKMKRYFMVTSEAVLLVIQAAGMGRGGEVFVLDMGEPVKILDLAKEMIRLYGFEPDKDVPIVFTGSRPGEKLFEEILTAEEGVVATKNQKIFMAKLSKINKAKFKSRLKKLKKVTEKLNEGEIKNSLKNTIHIN
ncbi:polysaccharide biosynthesis protein [Patescibacteria group bacterium]